VTFGEFLAARAAELRDGETPFLDACLILSHCLGISKDSLLARLSEEAVAVAPSFWDRWARRLAGESVAYIVGRKEFFGREFLVDERVLVPRPDTETLVAAALEVGDEIAAAREAGGGIGAVSPGRPGAAEEVYGGAPRARNLRLHDVCTGSGAVAVSVAAERPAWTVSASDISPEALGVARANSRRLLGRELPLLRADLLAGLGDIESHAGLGCFGGPARLGDMGRSFDIITANPPYVPTGETTALLSKGWREPALALDGGPDGLAIVARLIRQAGCFLAPGGFLLIETDALQTGLVRDMFRAESFRDIRMWKDLAGLERVTGARTH
jgi:release factor glutamine methyltransferase